ncbi:hypothetical protein [Fusobacterium perfoetens]|uniref:hypothetical protein n=1 Tax=Fusobacterium perfoetens TaxID=852 RepID=UPI0026EEF7A4|nr:hypothetical protein [Fusobacterium perfoetens]
MIEKKYDISFLNEESINKILENAKLKSNSEEEIDRILEKARLCEGITPEEAAILLSVANEELLNKMFKIAKEVKERIYGKRIVMFAPLYVSNYCVNNCKYCGYQHCNNDLTRKKLTREELVEEVKALEKLGHKRIVLEAGEDPINCSIDYILIV